VIVSDIFSYGTLLDSVGAWSTAVSSLHLRYHANLDATVMLRSGRSWMLATLSWSLPRRDTPLSRRLIFATTPPWMRWWSCPSDGPKCWWYCDPIKPDLEYLCPHSSSSPTPQSG